MEKPLSRRARTDEAWFAEWFEWGWRDLIRYLEKAALYEDWCRAHGRTP